MGETSDQIERHIQETRNDLSHNFSELEEKVKTAVDWRAQFEERPVTMMAMAFGGGVLLSALLPSLGFSRRRFSDSRRNAPSDRATPVPSISRTAYDAKVSQTLETWDSFKGALVGVATTKLSGFIEDLLLPGFKQEFTKAQTGNSFDRPGSSTSGQPTWQKSTATGG
jgi:hypothetical protein